VRLALWIRSSVWRFTSGKCKVRISVKPTHSRSNAESFYLSNRAEAPGRRTLTPSSGISTGKLHSDCTTVRQGAERLHGKCSTKVYEAVAREYCLDIFELCDFVCSLARRLFSPAWASLSLS